MRDAWRLFCQDMRHATTNVVSIIVCVGLVIVPSLYSWFNIAASWDPYANTGNLKIAVANADEGYKSALIPMRINIGEQVIQSLRGNDKFDWTITDEADAEEGVRSGAYYAAIVIPAEFSSDMLSSLSTASVKSGTLVYYTNQKPNAIAPIVTGKGADAVREQIDETFAETIADVSANVVSSLAGYLGSDQITGFASTLDTSLVRGSHNLRTISASLSSYAGLASSASSLIDSSNALLGTAGTTSADVADGLSESERGVAQLEGAVAGTTAAVEDALARSASGYDAVASAIDDAYATASSGRGDAASALRAAASNVDESVSAFQKLRATLVKLRDDAATESARDDIQKVIDKVDRSIADQQALETALETAATDVTNSGPALEATHAELISAVRESQTTVASTQASFEQDLKGAIAGLDGAVSDAASNASQVSSSLGATVATLTATTSSASGDLQGIVASLDEATALLDSSADTLDRIHTEVQDALSSGDVEQVRTIIGTDATGIATFLAAPVSLDHHAIFPIANNGSAMAPFYNALALWVGAIMLVALLKVIPSDKQLASLGNPKPRHVYMGRLGLFLVLSFLQATLLCYGDLFYLQIQYTDLVGFLLCGWLTSFVFMNIMYALTVSFGDVGKAIAVLLLVIQVAGSGGTFPYEMLPGFFQQLYPFLPFVHSITAQRAAIAGTNGVDYIAPMVMLALFVGPSLLLGLALRKPVVRLNRWIAEKLEDTKVM